MGGDDTRQCSMLGQRNVSFREDQENGVNRSDPPTERTVIEDPKQTVDPPTNTDGIIAPYGSGNSNKLLERLCQEMDLLKQQVEELKSENKRLSESNFDWWSGDAINNLMNDLSDHSDGDNNDPTSARNFSVHVLAPLLKRAATENDAQPRQGLKRESEVRWRNLKKCYEDTVSFFTRKRDLVLLHPEEVGKRDYTVEELHKISFRPFPTRIFITNIQLEWNTVWLRTRHTDHHTHKSSFIQVRDAFKADAITSNPPGAKYALTELLNMCYGMKESDYYSFACTLASAFSNEASNVEFEKKLLMHPARMEIIQARLAELEATKTPESLRRSSSAKLEMELLKKEQKRNRKQLLQLMDIVFSKLKQKKLLVDDNKDNIYRLVLCMTKYSGNWKPYFYAFFSFYFQVCAAGYVWFSLTDLDKDEIYVVEYKTELVYRNIWLAVGTFFYGAMVAWPEILSTKEVYKSLYRSEIGVCAVMDFVVNVVLPLLVATCGFLVVLQGESFLDGVLNAVALLFITEIDDQLPKLLELDKCDIVQGFLIDQAMEEFKFQNLNEYIDPIEFSDMHLTNTPESGSIPRSGVTFQPYEVFANAEAEQLGSTIAIDGNSPKFWEWSKRRLSNRASLAPTAASPYKPVCSKNPSRVGLCCSPRNLKANDVRFRQGDMDQQVANKRSVTAHCLLRKIEWQYTGHPKGLFAASSSPRIGCLILHKLIGGAPVRIEGKQKAPKHLKKPWFSITGVYIITSFSMSDDILRLRVCGSETAEHFTKAFKYYNLWPLSADAKHLLKAKEINTTQSERDSNRKVLFGTERVDGAPPLLHEEIKEANTEVLIDEEDKNKVVSDLECEGHPFIDIPHLDEEILVEPWFGADDKEIHVEPSSGA